MSTSRPRFTLTSDSGTPIVFTPLVIHIRSTDDIEDYGEGDKEIVLVTIKQYLAVTNDILRNLFPNVPEHIWAEIGEYPYCAVVISDGEPEGGPRFVQ